MASIILRSAGAAVGNALLPGIGGLVLGSLGRSVGGIIDGQLGLGSTITGPRLDNLSVQDSRYGAGIPLVYGHVRIAGNVIWSTDLIETTHDNQYSGGKGGAFSGSSTTSITYTYSVHCAVGICLGPIGGINTIWADSTVIYQNGVWTSGLLDAASIYLGTTSQAPDAFMQSMLGSGNVPAYRNTAYIVLQNLQLANFGNRLPNLTFEVLPVSTTTAPVYGATLDAQIYQHPYTATALGMPPLTLTNSGAGIGTLLMGGYVVTGSTAVFEIVTYDVTGEVPVETARIQSASFPIANPSDCSWAMAPDNRFVALFFLDAALVKAYLAIYDSVTAQFGAILAVTTDVTTTYRVPGWIDATHFLLNDITGTTRGLRAFARAGLGVIDMGITEVWGAGSSSYKTLFYAQFTPYAGGLLAYIWDPTDSDLTIYVRALAWRNNALAVGSPYTLVAGVSLAIGSAPAMTMTQTGDSEWTFCYSTTVDYQLMSFEPGLNSATITRPFQSFGPAFGVGTYNVPVYSGGQLILVQHSTIYLYYCVSVITLNGNSFTLATGPVLTTGTYTLGTAFGAFALDFARILVWNAGSDGEVGQLGILQRIPFGTTLAAILADILNRAGYAGGDYDVSALAGVTVDGYVLQEPMTARAAIEPLQVYTPFDLIETAGELKAVPRNDTPSATVPSTEWRATAEKQGPPPGLAITRAQELDLPLEIDIDYIDPSRNYEVNTQRARRIVTYAQAVQKITLPVVCDADLAKQIAETRLYTMWSERELIRIRISRRWLALDPGDVIDLGNGSLLRVTAINQAGSLIEIEGFYVYAAAFVSAAAADTGQMPGASLTTTVASQLYMLDAPLLQSSDDQPGIYAAATGLSGWRGATLWRAADGVNYSQIAALPTPATAGMATTLLGAQSGCYIDNSSTVNVQLITGSLSSCSDTDLLNGANAACLGSEIIQFGNATLIGPGLYTLSHLLRGRRGTEDAITTHAVGDNFIMLTPGTVTFTPALLTDRGKAYDFRALSGGQSLGDAQDDVVTYNLATIQPFAPVNLLGTRASGTGSDLTLVWNRRARLNADWVDFIDVPLDEQTEAYDVEIMNGATVLRTFSSINAPTVTYTAAMQTADWPSGVPSSVTVNVYQLSSRYGRGKQLTATV